ncbi:MAG: response regulator transcription factor [Planctomycetaceae bacterium]|nr:response regulator transcription factor [Planctomycetaceae bacterium]
MPKIRVLIADDHAVLRTGLRLLIHTQADMEVVGEAGTFPEAIEACGKMTPDVLTLDLNMPGGTGARAIADVLRVSPTTHVLVLTMHDDTVYLRACLAAGALGYVVKKAADTELLSAIRTLSQGRAYVNVTDQPVVSKAETLAATKRIREGKATPLDTLSEREREVLLLVVQGHTNQAIADKLFLSVKTVESYRARLMSKLGMHSRADLMRFAIDTGLLSGDAPTPPAGE